MRIESLEAYGVPRQMLRAWGRRYGELLPVQERAITQHGLLSGKSVVVFAPTSSGKTFVGELAAAAAAARQRRAVYLVPTKALAEEKYREFRAAYGPLGLRVVISTRERREFDGQIRLGQFDLAVAVNEKMRSLMAAAPDLLSKIGVLVADELQTLGDPERGPCLELLLTMARRAGSPAAGEGPQPQIIGLSAVLGRERHVADWLGASWLRVDERPVELRQGVFCQGVFHYVEHNSRREGEEEWDVPQRDEPAETMLALARWLGERGEQTIVFLPTKRACREFAAAAADGCDWPGAEEAREQIAALPPTSVRRALRELLASGVAFHNADLDWAERATIERAFHAGRIRLLCATSTLANGVNLPARNVIMDVGKWEYRRDLSRSTLGELSKAEFESMSGRAGRLAFSDDFGRAVLIAEAPFWQDTYLKRYVRGDFPPLEPSLTCLPPGVAGGRGHAALELAALSALPAVGGAGVEGLMGLLADTYSGHLAWQGERGRAVLREAVGRCVTDCAAARLLAQDANGLRLTPLGQVCVAQGLERADFCWLREWAESLRGGHLSEEEAMLVAATAPSTRELPLGGGAAYGAGGRGDWRGALRYHCETKVARLGDVLEPLLADARLASGELGKAARQTLAMIRWLGEEETEEVERGVGLAAGTLSELAKHLGWLVESLARIGQEVGWLPEAVRRVSDLAARLPLGLPCDAAGLAALNLPDLDRELLRRLVARGISSAEAFLEADLGELEDILPLSALRRLAPGAEEEAPAGMRPASARSEIEAPAQQAARARSEAAASSKRKRMRAPRLGSAHLLVLESGRPDRALVAGAAVPLTALERRLAELLAQHAGQCVPYEAIFEHLYGLHETATHAQLYFQKRNLLRKLQQALPGEAPKDPVVTIPRRGMMLALGPEQVLVA